MRHQIDKCRVEVEFGFDQETMGTGYKGKDRSANQSMNCLKSMMYRDNTYLVDMQASLLATWRRPEDA